MAISKKNRRALKYNGINFLWWVDAEFDGLGNMLSINIASEDKKFLINISPFRLTSEKAIF